MLRTKPDRQIVGIDLIRFGAACGVTLYHLCYVPDGFTRLAAQAVIPFPEHTFLRFGRIGIFVFFVISGFVIAYSAHDSTAYKFLRDRIVRLMPAVWIVAPITLVALLLIGLAAPDTLAERFCRSMVLFPFGPWIDSVYWTLPIEILFYASVLLLLTIKRFALLEPAMAAVGLASPFVPVVHYGCFFALGVFIWLALFDKLTIGRCVIMTILVVSCFWQIGFRYGCAIWFVCVIAIAVSVLFNERLVGIKRAARVLGLTSYPLYLLHSVVGAALIGALFRAGVDKYIAVVIGLATVMSVAVFIAVAIEPQFQRWLRSAIDGIPLRRMDVRQV